MYSELHPSKYLIRDVDFNEAQWGTTKDVPLTLSAGIAGGLVLVTKEREMWYEDSEGNDISLWMTRFYVRGDVTPFFWFNNDKIRDQEIQRINENLIRRIGEIEWVMIKWNTLER